MNGKFAVLVVELVITAFIQHIYKFSKSYRNIFLYLYIMLILTCSLCKFPSLQWHYNVYIPALLFALRALCSVRMK